MSEATKLLPDLPDGLNLVSKVAAERYCLRCQNALPETAPLAICPRCGLQYEPADPETYRTNQERRGWRFWFPGFCLAVAAGVISYGICLQNGELGFALFVAVPISFGAILGYSTRTRFLVLAILGAVTLLSVVMGIYSMGFAGFFCGLTLCLIFIAPTLFGIFLGWLLRTILKLRHWDQRWYFPLPFLIAFPFVVQAIENCLPQRTELATIQTRLTVNATPRAAWDAIMFYEEVEHRPPWLLRLALPKPIRSQGNKQQVGEIVRCFYDRGHLVKRISRREEGRLLAFEVIEQKLHFERDVALKSGSFEIRPQGTGAQITLTTRYQRHLSPRWVWEPIEQKVVHTLHGHVLEGMRRYAESQQERGPFPETDDPRYETQSWLQLVETGSGGSSQLP